MAKRKRKAHGDANYLSFIPVKNPEIEFSVTADEKVRIRIEWVGFYHRIAQRFFHRPRGSEIALDDYGSFLWQTMDGTRTVFELDQALKAQFPDMEKTLPRLIPFLEIMRDHHLIDWKENAS